LTGGPENLIFSEYIRLAFAEGLIYI